MNHGDSYSLGDSESGSATKIDVINSKLEEGYATLVDCDLDKMYLKKCLCPSFSTYDCNGSLAESDYVESEAENYGPDYGEFFVDMPFLSSGNRTTPEIDISTLEAVNDSLVQWTSDEPTDTSITIESAISEDGGSTWGAWQSCTSGSAVPGLSSADLTNARIKFKQSLSTTDQTVTPTLNKLELYLAGSKYVIKDVIETSDPSSKLVRVYNRNSGKLQIEKTPDSDGSFEIYVPYSHYYIIAIDTLNRYKAIIKDRILPKKFN